ncbi:hypothetical protein LCGC14_1504040 [marine sediment metagenome]|uniref:Uncharacterized protein n=1 Tax=marine sediment metagenome TaxID=412755 RepID=A0A0F9J394_9ZZZZ
MDDQKDGEKKPQTEAEKQKQQLAVVVGVADVDGTQENVTHLDALSSQWRQMAAKAIKHEDPETYAQYRTVKYATGEEPDLAQRKKAYQIIVERFLELGYTELDPLEPSKAQVVCLGWRGQALRLLKIVDEEGYAEFQKLMAGEGKFPNLKTRKKAFRFVVLRFLDRSYRLAGV